LFLAEESQIGRFAHEILTANPQHVAQEKRMINTLLLMCALSAKDEAVANLVPNGSFDLANAAKNAPTGFELSGQAEYLFAGYQDEIASAGIAFNSSKPAGKVSAMVTGLDHSKGKWIRFAFRGMAEDGFNVEQDALIMKIAFMSKGGTNQLDTAERFIYRELTKARADLAVNGKAGKQGAEAWRTYDFEELLPFAEVDSVKISLEFKNGASKEKKGSYFFVDDFELTQYSRSLRGLKEPKAKPNDPKAPDPENLVHLGGRWYFQAKPGENVAPSATAPLKVDYRNADRLFYKAGRWETPFLGAMTSWLKPGFLDAKGELVKETRFVPDNVVLTFDGSSTFRFANRNVPNHPTAKFPDTYGTQGYDPNYIQEFPGNFRLAIEPKMNPSAVPMTQDNRNRALPMGPVGLAVNGVVFFNPFDGNMEWAVDLMDRCCGHPAPNYQYHYHKYPICVNTPFADNGDEHSPIIGFGFDGIPVYGPYEGDGIMAKDSKTNPLNGFNAHEDAERGVHYHVTPGKFPFIIGGYVGQVTMRRGPGG